MGRGVTAPSAEALASLLAPYADRDLVAAGRLVDVPPDAATAALEYLPADLCGARLNGTQPAMTWLTAQATELDGRLVGSPVPGRTFVRFDGIQLSREQARALAARIFAEAPGALEAAVAEAWSSWVDEEPVWTGAGTDLLDGELPPGAAVVGLWWD
jgi:hypothetical protein